MAATRTADAGQPRNAASVATELIRQSIARGRLVPGQRLKEEELARELGISRTPVREALAVLQAEGLVDSSPNRGAVVRSYDAAEIDDLYQLRAVVEGFAARRAALRITDAQLAELRRSCDRYRALREAGDLEGLVGENALFHKTLLEAAGSERLAEVVRKVTEAPLVYRSYSWYTPTQTLASVQAHVQLVAALEAGDAERAELIMKEHVFEARDVLVAHLRQEEATA